MKLDNMENLSATTSTTNTSEKSSPEKSKEDAKDGKELQVMTSTHELLAATGGVGIASYVLSVAVSGLQIVLFVAILEKSTDFSAPDLSFEIVRIFIAIYLSAYLVQSVSDAFWSVFDREGEFDGIHAFSFLFMFILFLPVVMCIYILMAMWSGQWDQARLSVATLLEYIVLVSSLAATLLITKQQTDIVSSVFNFAGLLLILEFDDMIARLLKWEIVPYDPTSKLKMDSKALAKVKAHNNTVMQMTVFCAMLFPSLAYLLQ
jgi:hypothetical protein